MNTIEFIRIVNKSNFMYALNVVHAFIWMLNGNANSISCGLFLPFVSVCVAKEREESNKRKDLFLFFEPILCIFLNHFFLSVLLSVHISYWMRFWVCAYVWLSLSRHYCFVTWKRWKLHLTMAFSLKKIECHFKAIDWMREFIA